MNKIRILLADEQTLFRQGLKLLISAESDMEVVGDVGSGQEVGPKMHETNPDVILIDIAILGQGALGVTRQIKRDSPKTKVIILTSHDEEDALVQAVEARVEGYVLKTNSTEQLLTAIRQVVAGGNYLCPEMMSKLLEQFRTRSRPTGVKKSRFDTLSARELEVLKMLAEGDLVRQIAPKLGINHKTVEAHRANLMRKLDIHSKTELIKYAIEKRIIVMRNVMVMNRPVHENVTDNDASTDDDVPRAMFSKQ